MKQYISRVNNFLAISFVMLCPAGAFAQATAPKTFTDILEPNKLYDGERVVVTPPEEIQNYIKLEYNLQNHIQQPKLVQHTI